MLVIANKSAQTKIGIIAIVGRSNVGKSTFINAMVGEKIAIVTPKPQTTRDIIRGIYNDSRGQLVFLDTPGFFLDAHDRLSRTMIKRMEESMRDADIIVYMVDPSRPIGSEERRLAALISSLSKPTILVRNKSDVPHAKRIFTDDYAELAPYAHSIIDISSTQQKHFPTLIDALFALCPWGEPLFEPGQIRDTRHYVSEVIREKLLHTLSDELPYHVSVRVEEITDKKKALYILAIVQTDTERHKKMIIGKGGTKIKEMSTSGRKELELYFQKKVFLELFVKVDPHWMHAL